MVCCGVLQPTTMRNGVLHVVLDVVWYRSSDFRTHVEGIKVSSPCASFLRAHPARPYPPVARVGVSKVRLGQVGLRTGICVWIQSRKEGWHAHAGPLILPQPRAPRPERLTPIEHQSCPAPTVSSTAVHTNEGMSGSLAWTDRHVGGTKKWTVK